jgi:thioredoxin reductase (NADPH)
MLDAPGVSDFIGRGICYGSRISEASLYRGSEMFIIGSGNSAGQAAVYMSRLARQVTLIVRAHTLVNRMSHYLIQQIEAEPNIAVRYHTEVAAAEGSDRLEALALRDVRTGAETRVRADGLTILIGQMPYTEWAAGLLARDAQGFLLTGSDLRGATDGWALQRSPLFLETNIPGVFAAGDVRRGTPKRVASAVGDGALAVQLVHQYLFQFAVADARALNGGGVPRAVAEQVELLRQLA